ncbi:hypothetical protein PHMEG_00026537 [Phytophthora megakarya]|uniref:Uncharacterized protein n=1 Tax=Phytophthora megakarya TaxID=4795 RepID=A0A225V9H3_9STRA|nr:hypothetical protein PHMEG_00026537 [Phytophthora megakarya]
MDAIRNGDWKTGTSLSGKLANPECIRLVNLKKDKNCDNWAKQSMIQCGLDVSRDSVSKIDQLDQLSKELKQIIAFYPDAFEEGYSQGAMSANL